jgi:hypothetical protein
MLTYQLYLANETGEIVRPPEIFAAPDDVTALEQVLSRVRCAELWQDRRRVKRWELSSSG